mmetsp:Transcript_18302/g.42373  ORF Transcript_18302/g.42373 Transcript_18302/m.42373 type:complete len:126 (+) Transcript_18302:472-849(+)
MHWKIGTNGSARVGRCAERWPRNEDTSQQKLLTMTVCLPHQRALRRRHRRRPTQGIVTNYEGNTLSWEGCNILDLYSNGRCADCQNEQLASEQDQGSMLLCGDSATTTRYKTAPLQDRVLEVPGC